MRKNRFRGARAALAAACLALCASAPARADWHKIQQSGSLKVAVYNEFAPFSDHGAGIDVDLAQALANKLGLKLSLLPFPAGESLGDDLRNMVWKGHYLGYGPADVMLHVPVDKQLLAENDKVQIFAPYYVETVRLVRSARTIPVFDGLAALEGKQIGAEKVSISAMLMLGEENGKFRDHVRIYPTALEALEQLKAGALDAVLATRSEIESVLKGDPAFPVEEVAFQRLPRAGWAVGMAVRKDELEVARLLQAAMNELSASGELKAIFAKYGVRVAQP
ncbi:transporter substrate-binding domain-containing protein [Janthinobacterium sp.]|uniref:substrate-binding periplasmic protein n=1 Tax=Janthinobacterium sp. TaxID=1871054 RepID=UPI00293D9633|nr:transporter substrate-binding domain-containing protein [Janthinobacterium sp.]